ncbi:ATP-binding protein [Streptomyces gardneri]|uniref:ATP-binding protein n=1 Tax=Streptomyces gardneri TaxID=66892 RepID=UPI0007C6CE42|nr:ATP-binding protein [Streptomyces gardneri]QPK49708.1 ATP-binding protein [Streptomyces gardneri]WRK41263.1 ATP-binding protein [Streptomyces venezuelae]
MSASPTPFRPALIASLLTLAAGGALAVAATTAAPAGVRPALGWFAACGVLLLSASAFAVTWYARTSRVLARRAEVLAAELASRDAYTGRYKATAERETAALTARYEEEAADSAARHTARTEELVRSHASETAQLRAKLAADTERLEGRLRRAESARSAAMAAAANAAGRMQALATSMMADLRDMEHRHADEDVLTDLLHLDHRTAQAGRLADSIAVLTGARSGRRWTRPIVMESILRGAMGRIGGYQRVRLHSGSEAAVTGHAAEGIMHALAEILDNAANFSPPNAEVHVYVEEVPAGLVITVEDSGLAMSDVQLRRAEAAVGSAAQDLAGLSGTRLGLHVVGRLARKHGLTVSFRPSARGGTGVLLMIPQELVSRVPEERTGAPAEPAPPVAGRAVTAPAADRTPPSATRPAPAPASGPAHEPETTHEPVHDGAPAASGAEETPDGIVLPRRRRGQTLAAQLKAGEAPAEPRQEAPRTGPAAAAPPRFGSFHRAVRGAGGRAADDRPADTSVPSDPQDPAAAPHPSASSNSPYSEGNPR